MKKEVLKAEMAFIEKILNQQIGRVCIESIVRMGGLTNHSYKVVCDNGKAYAFRIPGEGTESIINRSDEKISTELACQIGIDAELLYFGSDGTKVMHYISDAETMTAERLRTDEVIRMVTQVFQKLHGCGIDTGVPFEIFEMADTYEKFIRGHKVTMYDDYEDIKNVVLRIKKQIDAQGTILKVPCHNDSLCENWIYGEGKMHLIDWEYAGMNDPMWDLADVSIEAEYTKREDEALLQYYLGTKPSVEIRQRFVANKIYLDYLWTLWGKSRVPFDGDEMEEYAQTRYERLKRNIQEYGEV